MLTNAHVVTLPEAGLLAAVTFGQARRDEYRLRCEGRATSGVVRDGGPRQDAWQCWRPGPGATKHASQNIVLRTVLRSHTRVPPATHGKVRLHVHRQRTPNCNPRDRQRPGSPS